MTDLHLDPAAAEAFRQRHLLRQVEAGGQAWTCFRDAGRRGGGVLVLFLPGVLGEAYDAALVCSLRSRTRSAFWRRPSRRWRWWPKWSQALSRSWTAKASRRWCWSAARTPPCSPKPFSTAGRIGSRTSCSTTARVPTAATAGRNPRNVWFWRVLPLFLLRAFFQLRFNFQLRSLAGLSAEQENVLQALRARYAAKAAALERTTALSQLGLAIEINAGDPVDAAPLGGWPGKIVISARSTPRRWPPAKASSPRSSPAPNGSRSTAPESSGRSCSRRENTAPRSEAAEA